MTSWTITEDHTDTDDTGVTGSVSHNVSITGPSDTRMTREQIIAHPKAIKFRMYDDDNVLYYEGYLVGDDLFAPLDDFGTPNAGATSIRIYQDGIWKDV